MMTPSVSPEINDAKYKELRKQMMGCVYDILGPDFKRVFGGDVQNYFDLEKGLDVDKFCNDYLDGVSENEGVAKIEEKYGEEGATIVFDLLKAPITVDTVLQIGPIAIMAKRAGIPFNMVLPPEYAEAAESALGSIGHDCTCGGRVQPF